MPLNEHKKRVLTALVGVAFVIGLYTLFAHGAVLLLSFAIALVSYREFLGILLNKEPEKQFRDKRLFALLVAAPMLSLLFLRQEGDLIPLYLAFLAFCLQAIRYSHQSQEAEALGRHLRDAFAQSFGLFYIAGFLSFVPSIHAMPLGPNYLLFLMLIVWGGDIGGYYGGKNFGRHKLSPSISPGKTWEGSVSGILACVLIAVAMKYTLLPQESWLKLALVAACTSAVAQAGDLIESLVKRVGGVKDSGSLFPGHGGVYDRFDSLILAAPLFYFLVNLA